MITKKKLIEQIDFLEKELEKKEKELKEKERKLEWADERNKKLIKNCDRWYESFVEVINHKNNLYPSHIIHNKKTTVVWFDNEKVIVKLAPGETGDVYSAVAYAIAKHMYKNNTQFKKYVDRRIIKHEK